LERFLAHLPEVKDANIISGIPSGDDAGIYRLTDDVTIVQTVDVFTPCVDDPFLFGRICAANCLSDIYAMGGIPKTALSVLAFPSETLDGQIMYLMMKGAMEVLAEAKCSLLGGHSIKDEEIKLGFAITGIIDPAKAVELETAVPGDVLVLTKPLGVGVLNFARQIGKTCPEGLAQAEKSMATLNKLAADAMNEVGVSACTDITGFGLFGHLIRMARHSGVSMRVFADALPVFDGVLELIKQGVIPGAIERNYEFAGEDLTIAEGVDEVYKYLGCDAQTSGGLLIAVPGGKYEKLIRALEKRGIKPATIGEILEKSDGSIELVASPVKGFPENMIEISKEIADKATISSTPASAKTVPLPEAQPAHEPGCCADIFGAASQEVAGQSPAQNNVSVSSLSSTAPESMNAFGNLMSAVAADGKIDARTKELMLFSLVILSRCEPCIEIHYDKAIKMGISREELDEAAWCAISMGGAPSKMFYSGFLKRKIG
jgi:selenide,water dikinase